MSSRTCPVADVGVGGREITDLLVGTTVARLWGNTRAVPASDARCDTTHLIVKESWPETVPKCTSSRSQQRLRDRMTSVRLLLIRHAEAENNVATTTQVITAQDPSEPRLTDVGRSQAVSLAHDFRAGRLPTPDALYSSPMRRALDTAVTLSHTLRLEILHAHDAFEIVQEWNTQGRGSVEDLPTNSICNDSQFDPLHDPNKHETLPRPVESAMAARLRAAKLLQRLQRTHQTPSELVALVTHEQFYQQLLACALGLSVSASRAVWFRLNNTGHTLLDLDHIPHPTHRKEALVLWMNRLDHCR